MVVAAGCGEGEIERGGVHKTKGRHAFLFLFFLLILLKGRLTQVGLTNLFADWRRIFYCGIAFIAGNI
jgi:hypothetical protein